MCVTSALLILNPFKEITETNMSKSNGKYKVELNFVECSTEEERIDREDRIISILIDNAIKIERKKKKLDITK
jgi:hypothetical protein